MTAPRGVMSVSDRIRRLTRGQFRLLMVVGVGATITLFSKIGTKTRDAEMAELFDGKNSTAAQQARSAEAGYRLWTLGVAIVTFGMAWVRLGSRSN